MLIGDWDRHEDQWRWAQFNQPNGDKIYKPIPRDRDQVFSNFDGSLLSIVRFLAKPSKQLQVYDDEINDNDLRWMNNAGIKLDRALIKQSGIDEWIKQAEFIQKNITSEVIENAFKALPPEVQDNTLEKIKGHFINRKADLNNIAKRYYEFLNSLVILTGTDKDDFVDIVRQPNNKTHITISRNKKGKRADKLVDRVFDRITTKEIWIYGLDDKDNFNVTGKGKNLIKIRIIGGQNKDSYNILNGKRIKIYDYKSKESEVIAEKGTDINYTDFYDYNIYDYKKHISSINTFAPLIGFNPDDGFLAGISLASTKYSFERNPFTRRHRLKLGYYFATEGFDLNYDGEYNVNQKWNLHINAHFTSDNFARNFFGFGNETENFDDDLDLDFNRVRTSIYDLKIGILKKGPFGSDYGFRALFEGIKLDPTNNRFITLFQPNTDSEFYDRTYFGGIEGVFKYQSFDNKINPTRAMDFNIEAGAKTEFGNSKQTFGFIESHLGFYNSISKNKKLVLKTDIQTQLRFGNDISFYQAANIGGKTGLRGYRTQRFTGQNSLVGNADIRYSFNKIRTRTAPIQLGIFGGYDLGRVWAKNENSDKWHSSYGSGFWISTAETLSGTFNLFNSSDGIRFSFGFGLSF